MEMTKAGATELDLEDPTMNLEQENLPEEMLAKIFEFLPNKKSLLNCRLVCKFWNIVVLNSAPSIMRKLKFRITDINSFMNSTIAGTVRSVCFPLSLPVFFEQDQDTVSQFIRIADKIEKIQIGNVKKTAWLPTNQKYIDEGLRMIPFILQQFPLLKKLTIFETGDRTKNDLAMLPIPNESKLQTLVINTTDKSQKELGFVQRLILSSPSLTSIQIINTNKTFKTNFAYGEFRKVLMMSVLMDHMQKYERVLKRIIWIQQLYENFDDPGWVKFMMSCGLNKVECSAFSKINLNSFIKIRTVELTEENCWALNERGILYISGNEFLQTEAIGYCTNLKNLSLIFKRLAEPRELWFLQNLKSIKVMSLKNDVVPGSDQDLTDEQQQHQAGVVPDSLFECGFPTLVNLKVIGHVFQVPEIAILRFPVCFPSLERLHLDKVSNLPEDIFKALSQLRNLESPCTKQLHFING